MRLRGISLLCLAVGGGWSSPLPDNQFATLSYETIVSQLHDLAANYPHLAQVRMYGYSVVCMCGTLVRSSTREADN